MNNYETLIKNINETAQEILVEVDNDRDVAIDRCYEAADSSEYVSYYHKSWELIDIIKDYDIDRFYEAESEVFELLVADKNTTLNQLATLIAYHIVRDLLIDAVELELVEA